jgi:dual specificity phosphatase 12
MRPALDEGLLQGRLECANAKCAAQLGRYAWQGMKCSCGVWVCPAFSVQKGRVDEIVKKTTGDDKSTSGPGVLATGPEATGIRLPPGMKGKENL